VPAADPTPGTPVPCDLGHGTVNPAWRPIGAAQSPGQGHRS
jgi:hypothetical protein